MNRTLLSRRWLGFALAVLVLATVCVRLGVWQFDRLDERQAENATVTANLATDPVPLETLGGADPALEWRQVTVSGTYDPEHQVVVRYQTRSEGPGVDVVTPLVRADGTGVLVDRGWIPAPTGTADLDDVPEPTPGQVTVTGWLRINSTADADAVTPSEGSVRAVSSAGFTDTVPYSLSDGYVQLLDQSPAPADPLVGPEEPDTGQGPHFFYGLQWMFFAGLALFGWCYFAWSETHPRRRPRASQRETREPVRQ